MSYRLVVVTHGPGDWLTGTIHSFLNHASPQPTDILIWCDGTDAADRVRPLAAYLAASGYTVDVRTAGPQEGFCTATRRAWQVAAAPGPDFVFWLEHDFDFLREIDVAAMADVLSTWPTYAQMSLLRGAVNDAERAAGGLYALYRDRLTPQQFGDRSWLHHAAYLTTNPSLMRRAFMAEHPWPEYPERCEGHFGLDLIADGYEFGIWGDGSEWIRHTGERRGHGY